MEHPNQRKITKLRFYKRFQKNTFFFNTHVMEKLANTDNFFPAFLHIEKT